MADQEVSDAPVAFTLPRIKDDAGADVPEWIARRVRDYFAERQLDPALPVVDYTLTGYWQLGDRNVLVFDTTRESWDDVISDCLAGKKGSGGVFLNLFDDLPLPRPSARDVRAVVESIRSNEIAPPFVECTLSFNVDQIVRDRLSAVAMTEQERLAWFTDRYQTTISRSVYPTLRSFIDAVDDRLSNTVISATSCAPVENITPAAGSRPDRPALRPDPSRELTSLLASAKVRGRGLLEDAAEFDYAERLGRPLRAEWTRRPVKSAWAYWSPRISGKSRGAPIIRVNRALQPRRTQIPDTLIEYLLWHELCHHIHPLNGHDERFHRLPTMWPDFAPLDHDLEALDRNWDLGPITPLIK